MTKKLPTMKQIRVWVKECDHSYKKGQKDYGPFFYNLRYWGSGHVRVVTNSLKSFKRICAVLMDADGWKWKPCDM